ncbi:MAG: hypothetical protein WHV44_02525 [Anaerolineales bacterium]
MYRTLKRFSLFIIFFLLGVTAVGVAYLNETGLMREPEITRPSVTPIIPPTMQPVTPAPSATASQPPASATPSAAPTEPPPPTSTPESDAPTPSQPASNPTRNPSEQNGALLENLSDGATRFTDLNGGYTLTFPAGWTVIRINQPEFTRLTLNEALQDPALQRFLISLQQLDPNAYRVFALDLSKRQPGNDQITFIEIRLDTQETLTVDQLRARYYQFFKTEYKVTQMISNDIARNINNLRFGLVEGTVQGRAATGQPVAQYIKTALLTPYGNQQLRISLVTLEAFRYDLGPVINQIVDTYQEIVQ